MLPLLSVPQTDALLLSYSHQATILYLIFVLTSSYSYKMPKEAMLQLVEWKQSMLFHSSSRLIGFCVDYLGALGTASWREIAKRQLLPSIYSNRQISKYFYPSVEFDGVGFSLIFYGPHHEPIPVIHGDILIWQQREPRFVFLDKSYLHLRPRIRTALYDTCGDISLEMARVYKMRVSMNPLTMVFPMSEYARMIGLTRAALL